MAYQTFLTHQDEVLSKVTALFSDCESRNLIQSTRTYQAALNTLTNPRNLRNGIVHDETITRYEQKAGEMTAISSVSVASPSKWSVKDAEYRALLAGDIPRFTTKAGEPHLYFDGDRVIDEAFDQTGIETVRNRIRQLSQSDMQRQRDLIRACLCDRSVGDKMEHHDEASR